MDRKPGNNNISVIRVRDVLIVTMPPEPDDSVINALQVSVLNAMERHESQAVLLDISSVEIFDSFFARTVSETAQMVRVMGGRTIIVGMRPAVAITLVELGMSLTGVKTALNVDAGMELLRSAVDGEREFYGSRF